MPPSCPSTDRCRSRLDPRPGAPRDSRYRRGWRLRHWPTYKPFHGALCRLVRSSAANPPTRDFSRFDLNGDGFTGGGRHTTRWISIRPAQRASARRASARSSPRSAARNGPSTRPQSPTRRRRASMRTAGLYSGDPAARNALLVNLCNEGSAAAALELHGANATMGFCSARDMHARQPGVVNPGIGFSATGGGIFLTPFAFGDFVNIEFRSGHVEAASRSRPPPATVPAQGA